MSDEIKRNWIDAANARLALADKFFWFSMTSAMIAGGIAQIVHIASPQEDIPRLTLALPDEPGRAVKIDRTPTATIRK